MDLGKALIESNSQKPKGQWKQYSASIAVHAAIVGTALALSLTASQKVAAEEKPVPVYIEHAAAAPPPPPPPPAARASSQPASHPKPVVQPVQVVQPTFHAPVETPKELPTPTEVATTDTTSDNSADTTPADTPAGVEGGVEGGVTGGVQGGQIGGVTGGQLGGVVGGTVGGVVGGTPGGTGTAPVAAPAGDSGPMRVGGDVQAPTVTNRVEPAYTEPARRARVTGVVILEAVIDSHGNVDRVRVIRGLPLGLSESAEAAVRRWKFRPGSLHGQPVDVIFNLTVNFQLGADGGVTRPKLQKAEPKSMPAVSTPAPEPAPEPAPTAEPAPAPAEPPAATDPATPPQP